MVMPAFYDASLRAHAASKRLKQAAVTDITKDHTYRSANKLANAHHVAIRLHSHAIKLMLATSHMSNDPEVKRQMQTHMKAHLAHVKEHVAAFKKIHAVRKKLKAESDAKKKSKPEEFAPSEPLP